MPMASRSCSHTIRPNMDRYKERRPIKYDFLFAEAPDMESEDDKTFYVGEESDETET